MMGGVFSPDEAAQLALDALFIVKMEAPKAALNAATSAHWGRECEAIVREAVTDEAVRRAVLDFIRRQTGVVRE